MDHFEMVERLRDKTGVTYEEAKTALEATDWDLLDAVVYLEQAGKVQQEQTAYTTQEEPRAQEAESKTECCNGFTSVLGRIGKFLASAVNTLGRINMDVYRKGEVVMSVPLLALILLLMLYGIIIPVMIVGLFFGFTYRFRGNKATDTVNKVMDKAAEVANNIKTGAQDQKEKE